MNKQKCKPDYSALVGIRSKFWILLLFATLFACGCIGPYSDCITGSGNVVSEEFTVDEFHSVGFGIPGNVYITQGTPQSLMIEAEDNVLEVLTAKVENGRLTISSDRCFRNIKPINVYVSMNEVRDLSNSGSGDIIGQSEINSDTLKLSISGSGSSDLTMNVEELNTVISGSGKSNLKGTAKVHNSVIRGSGDINAFDLSTERTDITISGSGNAQVDASRELDVSIFGSGNVYYTGDAALNQTVSGSGIVVKR
uniref:Putative auto-transporter adhesin head GIN domain-containing protein n=1 Tax=Candidatus Methanogaster sp. ANME-2c ERB4 TaxID=2759911 RepID=A0A7G9Y6N6_9EURY|nr:hypothetical protein FICJDHNH_00010 [Methanosarcinales archaeon ANME-2c ERB4]QNO43975.1 hypothetical protein AECFJODE_00028 [Methanosarcinales archaeon ANME-2c ERB4]QNO50627.1 hypothetical protein JEJMEHHC_00008 [Methanosarcinales archaeon ANME-2c ERB4]